MGSISDNAYHFLWTSFRREQKAALGFAFLLVRDVQFWDPFFSPHLRRLSKLQALIFG
jgi:hypothetical protein